MQDIFGALLILLPLGSMYFVKVLYLFFVEWLV